MLTREFAERFARDWVAAWNGHDLEEILAHYSDDVTMSSPRIAALTDETSGVLTGKGPLADYWRTALANSPDLRFTLIGVYLGSDSVAVHYEGMRGAAIEVFFFDDAGLVLRAAANYSTLA